MNISIESMTKLELPNFTVRLWVTEDSFDNFDKLDHDFIRFTVKKVCENFDNSNVAYLAKEILNIAPEISAVEVINKSGDGVVLYKNWPE